MPFYINPPSTEYRCTRCNSLLAKAKFFAGSLSIKCKRCKTPCVFQAGWGAYDAPEAIEITALIGLMEERWESFANERAKGRGGIAVGLRFTVFQRDGFRCHYCGVSASDGALLHADHVIPRSKGGPTALENLVTACFDCNIGKRDRLLD